MKYSQSSFFFFPRSLSQISTPTALSNAAVLLSAVRSPMNLSLRWVSPSKVSCLRFAWRGQSWSRWAVVTGVVSHGHISVYPILSLLKRCDLRLMCPVPSRNIVTWSSHRVAIGTLYVLKFISPNGCITTRPAPSLRTYIQVAAANVVDGFVVYHEGAV